MTDDIDDNYSCAICGSPMYRLNSYTSYDYEICCTRCSVRYRIVRMPETLDEFHEGNVRRVVPDLKEEMRQEHWPQAIRDRPQERAPVSVDESLKPRRRYVL